MQTAALKNGANLTHAVNVTAQWDMEYIQAYVEKHHPIGNFEGSIIIHQF
jgi:hypothetical protein